MIRFSHHIQTSYYVHILNQKKKRRTKEGADERKGEGAKEDSREEKGRKNSKKELR